MGDRFTLAAQVLLTRRLKGLIRVDDLIEVDTSHITCAEYQLFLDAQGPKKNNLYPDHWQKSRFSSGNAKEPVTGVRAKDAQAFCDWLSQQKFTPGYRYRLPTTLEIEEYPSSNATVGFWCKQNQEFVVAGIEPRMCQTWQEQFNSWIVQADYHDLSSHEFVRIKARNLTRKLNRYISSKLDRDRTQYLARYLDMVRKIDGIHRVLTGPNSNKIVNSINPGFTQKITHVRDNARKLALIRDLNRARILSHGLVRDLASAYNDVSGLEQTHHDFFERDLKLELERARELDLYINLDRKLLSDLKLNFSLFEDDGNIRSRVRDRNQNVNLNHAQELVRQIGFSLNIDIDVDTASNLLHILELKLERDLALGTMLDRSSDHKIDSKINVDRETNLDSTSEYQLDFTRNRTQDYLDARGYLLCMIMVFNFLIDIYERLTKKGNLMERISFGPRNYDEVVKEYTHYRNLGIQAYCFFFLLELRRQGKMYAWEGIRIVRERTDD